MSPQSVQARLAALAEKTRAVIVGDFEEESPATVLWELVPRVREILRDTASLFERVSELYEPEEDLEDYESSGAFYRLVDRLVKVEMASQQIADLAFMGTFELRGTLRRFDQLEEQVSGSADESSSEAVLDEAVSLCFRGKRKILKVVTALENAAAKEAGLEPRLDFLSELNAALEIRRAYTKMRRAVLEDGEPSAEAVGTRLHRACTAMARLRGRDAYWRMRYGDRRGLRDLQRRVLEWTRVAGENGYRDGLRLWQDVSAWVQLLREINRRAELQEHDREVVDEAYAELCFSDPPWDRISEDLWHRLATLYGCDDTIDDLVERGERSAPEAWREPLERLRAKFRTRPEAVAASAGLAAS